MGGVAVVWTFGANPGIAPLTGGDGDAAVFTVAELNGLPAGT